MSGYVIKNDDPDSSQYPFVASGYKWLFVYYDPNLECKRAFEKGKKIQFKSHLGVWCDCGDTTDLWDDSYEYRIKPEEPEEPGLKWTDLDIGDVIETLEKEHKSMVINIDYRDKHGMHICAGFGWIIDEELKNWRKANG